MFVPTRIGRYEIKGRIGGGGMGTLYLARDTNPTTDRLVALKLLRTSFESDEIRKRFAREAQALAELNHPNIVIIHDSGEFQDSPFIVMEYIRGETLAESIKRRAPISLGQKLGWLSELCAGLAHAHEAGIIHRDIKPANLMVDVHRRLKVLDFGIARVDTGSTGVAALTRLNVSIGTPGYMSPEQIEGAEIDARSDLFSVGAVAYELISYHEAFPGTTTRQIETKVLNEQPVPLASSIPGLDPEIAEIISSALEKDPRRRCQHATTLGRAFERVRARLEEEERLPRATPSPKPGADRRSRHERAAQAAYERALNSHREGADGYARRSAMEALAEFPRHVEAHDLLVALGHLRDVEPWLPPSGEASTTPVTVDESGRTVAGQPTVRVSPTISPEPALGTAPTMVAQPAVSAEPTIAAPPTVAAAPAAVAQPTEAGQGPPAGEAGQSAESPPEAAAEARAPAAPLPLARPPLEPAGAQPPGPADAKPPAKAAQRQKAQQPPRAERRPGRKPVARVAVRAAIIVLGLVVAAGAGALVARRLWLAPGGDVQLTITPPQGGTIVGDGIECGTRGTNCSVTRPRGTAVALQAQPDEGFVFTAFTGDCASTGGTVLESARTCGASFTPIVPPAAGAAEHLLTVDLPTDGTIEGAGIRCGTGGTECSAKQAANVQITLTATPNAGFTLGAFTGDCAPGGVTTMSAARRCGATFVPAAAPPSPEFVLTITRPTGGTILGAGVRCGAAGSECVSRHPQGFAVTLRHQAEKDYRFETFTGDCSPSGKTVMTAPRNCSARFVKEPAAPPLAAGPLLTITPSRGGTVFANGIVCGSAGTQCAAAQPAGSSLTLRAQADSGFRFVGFTGDCDRGGAVVMSAPRTCSGSFVSDAGATTAASFVLTVQKPRDGTITGDAINCGDACQAGRPRGTVVQLRARPNPGYRFVGFTGDCDSNGVTVMTAHRTCGAKFERSVGVGPQFTLTIRRPRNGTVFGELIACGTTATQCSASYPVGTFVQLRGEPGPGFTFAGFTDDCTAAGVILMTSHRTCGATFTAAPPGSSSPAAGTTVQVIAGQVALIHAPSGWTNLRWQISADGGRSWRDVSEGDDYGGVNAPTLTIKRPRADMSGRQYRARTTRGTAATSTAVTLIVKPS